MEFQSCQKTFNNIKDEKKITILDVSMKEFSGNGYNSANINTIAEHAGVSVGAMYKYFENKRALYLTCVEWAMFHLNKEINKVVQEGGGLFTVFEKIIIVIQKHRNENEQFTKLYYEMATESNAEYAMLISSQIEGLTSDLYSSYIDEGKASGIIREDIDSRYFAFLIDNILMMLQFSYSCEYYKDRLRIYTYDDVFENDDKLREQVMLFVKGALSK